MARNEDKNGYLIPVPKSIYDKAYVVGNGLSKKSGDVTGLGWHPSGGIPEPRRYFGNSAGRHNSVSENEQAKTLGNKWRRK
jgi:hypothetical protein